MLSFNSSLLAIASDFVGKYSPFQAIQITPAKNGGVYLASTDCGKIACLAFDPSGDADESALVIPTKDLLKVSRGIKTGERTIRIEDNQAVVTTFMKTTSKSQEVPILRSQTDFPPLAEKLQDCINRWSSTPSTSTTAGRYNSTYINKAIKSLSLFDASIVLSAFDGGPLRIQGDSNNLNILVMPQTAEPIPPVPDWLVTYASA
tara:strand:- start:1660 stop:2271 length:612 start_codon:yes stop_codon:yes gene_type:complete